MLRYLMSTYIVFFFFTYTATTQIYTDFPSLHLHDALPILARRGEAGRGFGGGTEGKPRACEELDHLALGHRGRAVERHMLQEMSQPALVLGLVEAADVEAHADDDAVLRRAIVQQRIFHPVGKHAEDHVRVDRQVAVRIVPSACGVGLRITGDRKSDVEGKSV